MTTSPFNDEFNDDEAEHERMHAQVESVTEQVKEFAERASAELGVYLTHDAAIQHDPEHGAWIIQTLVEFGDRAYAKAHEDKRNDDKVIQEVELDMIADDLLRKIAEDDDDSR